MEPLPEELLKLICDNLQPSGYTHLRQHDNALLATLRNLSLSSKALRRIVQPIMLHTLNFEKRPWSQVRSVLRLISRQPHLAHFVRKVIVANWESYEPSKNEQTSSMSGMDVRVIRGLIKELPLPQSLRRDLSAGINAGSKDAEFTTLLCFCTKLENINAQLPGPLNNKLVKQCLSEAAESAGANSNFISFRRIQNVQLDGFPEVELSDITEVLCLPALTTFDCYLLNHHRIKDLSTLCSSIKTLRLAFPVLREQSLEQLLCMCPNVTNLELEWRFGFVSLVEDYGRWGDVLRKHGARLERLCFEVAEANMPNRQDLLPFGIMGDLSSLVRLKWLDVPFDSLCNSELPITEHLVLQNLLPLSLETLLVSSFETRNTRSTTRDYLNTQLNKLIHDTRFMALKRICLDDVPKLKIRSQGTDWKLSRDINGWAELNKHE
ncbi:hypothetical protein PRZ48_011408 [Zasmidium cellare]|uniref:F-box domain-containing protein n=1 Tax=Zasmidium cellare TaxID=395010 RepID=A0ABR0E6B8_ZASCE|nr:hypothetical protein PRZ48_011408 [Zasmidium cellare]